MFDKDMWGGGALIQDLRVYYILLYIVKPKIICTL